MTTVEVLKLTALFREMDAGQLEKVAELCDGVSCKAGDVLFKEGDKAENLFVLVSGRMSLDMSVNPIPTKPGLSTTVEIAGENDVIGWSALVDPYHYGLTAKCLTGCELYSLNGEALCAMADADSGFGYKLYRNLVGIVSMRHTQTRLRLVSGIGLAMVGRDLMD